MTKIEITLAIIIFIQWIFIIYMFHSIKHVLPKDDDMPEIKPAKPIMQSIRNVMGIKKAAYYPHKDESKILDGEVEFNFE